MQEKSGREGNKAEREKERRGFVLSLETKIKHSSPKFKMSHVICHGVRDHKGWRLGDVGDGSALRSGHCLEKACAPQPALEGLCQPQ